VKNDDLGLSDDDDDQKAVEKGKPFLIVLPYKHRFRNAYTEQKKQRKKFTKIYISF